MKEERKNQWGGRREGKWNTGCRKREEEKNASVKWRDKRMKENEAEREIMMLGKGWEIKRWRVKAAKRKEIRWV